MKMLSTAFRPIGQTQVTPPGKGKSNEPIVIEKMGSLNNTLDATVIDQSEFTALDNTESIDGSLQRRFGNSYLLPFRPDINKVLAFEAFQQNDGTIIQLRVTKDAIYRRGVSSWTAITGVTLTGADTDRFSLAASNNEFFCANGVEKVMKFDFGANTMAEIASSRAYKYIAAIGTRIVGAYNNTPASYNPIEIGTSGNLNFSDWDPTSDPSAYRGYLYESQDTYTDFITGLAGVGETAVVMRERSIWLGEPQPVAQQPFYFYPKIMNIGCDSPYSFQRVYGGVCFADRRTEMVYYYDPKQGDPTPIAVNVYKEMGLSAYDPETFFSGWDASKLTYILGIPQPATAITHLWKYSFKNQGWTKDIINNASSVSSLPYSAGSFTIDDAAGTIDAATATIDNASPVILGPGAKFTGLDNGHIYMQNDTLGTDVSEGPIPISLLSGAVSTVAGAIADLIEHTSTTFIAEVITKTFEAKNINLLVEEIQLFIQPLLSGSIILSYSKDNGVTWTAAKVLNYNALDKDKRVILSWTKLVRARQITFKLTSISGAFKLVKITIKNASGGEIRQ